MNFFRRFSAVNKKKNIRDMVMDAVYPNISIYADWYAENGVYLPTEFEFDPSGWTEVLRKIQRAFTLYATRQGSGGELMKASILGSADDVHKLEAEILEGFILFGKYLTVLDDESMGDL